MPTTAFTGLVNIALLRIGANPITDLAGNEPNALKATAVLPYVLEEVMQARDWRFAKTRAELSQANMDDPTVVPALGSTVAGSLAGRTYSVVYTLTNTYGESLPSTAISGIIAENSCAVVTMGGTKDRATGWNCYVDILGGTSYTKQNTTPIALNATLTEAVTGFTNTGAAPPTINNTKPIYGYSFAYPLPTDFLRLVKPRSPQSKGINPAACPYGALDLGGIFQYANFDPPVYPQGFIYVLEAMPNGSGLALLANYDNTDNPIYINYIRKATDEALFTPAFKRCLIDRLAQELAISVTESLQKSQLMQQSYEKNLVSAAAVNESLDYLVNETGNNDWENAGR